MASAMMKAARKSSSSLLSWFRSSEGIAPFSTEAMAIKPAKGVRAEPAEGGKDLREKAKYDYKLSILYRKIVAVGGRPPSEVTKVVNKWVQQGNSVTKIALIGYIHSLRKLKRHRHALQLFKFMDDKKMRMTDSDHAVRLELVYRSAGIKAAEAYFEELPEKSKNNMTYGSLLSCFCAEKSLEKAIALVQQMKEQDIKLGTLGYGNLLTLYMKLEEHDKVLHTFQFMKNEGVEPNTHTYCILMNSHAALNDFDAVESVLQEVKSAKGGVYCNWRIYSNVAAIYVASGNFGKAESNLQVIEKLAPFKDPMPYKYLISLYTSISNQPSVKRVWDSLKTEFPKPINMCYLEMFHSFSKFGDIDGLKQCFNEWESNSTIYDIRLANLVIITYLRQGMVDEAKAVLERASKRGSIPNFKTFEIFIDFYLGSRQYDLALAELEKAAKKVKNDEWRPNESKVMKFLAYFEEIKDVNGAEKFFEKLKKLNCVSVAVYNSLLSVYIAAGRSDPGFRQRMLDDEIEISSETEELLDKL